MNKEKEKLDRTIDRIQSIDIRCIDSNGKKVILRYPVVVGSMPSLNISYEPSFSLYTGINLSFRSDPMQVIEIVEE